MTYDHLVIHCSATRASDDYDADWIDNLHKGFGWRGIGYHFVIKRDGEWETGRPLGESGAHVGDCNVGAYRHANWNSRSIGICLIGGVKEDGRTPENNYTRAQWNTLRVRLPSLWKEYPKTKANTMGHRDLIKLTGAPAKACPCFSVRSWIAAEEKALNADTALAVREEKGERLSFIEGLWATVKGLRSILAPETHVVQRGDTLWAISNTYGVALKDLVDANGIEDPNNVPVGTVLRIFK